MKTKILSFAAAAMLAFAAPANAESIGVGFVYVSPIGEAGWTYQHDLGRRALERKFGDRIKVTFVENIAEGADAERAIEKLAREHDIVFATSFGYMEPTLKVAKRHANRKFEHATGYKTAANVSNYLPRFYEGRYLGGMIAGAATESNIIGYVGAFPIPEVVRGINAFMLGARSVNPQAQIRVIWVNSWYDPGKEREAADTLLSQGADIITHHTDSPAAVQAAQENGKKAVAYHSDMSAFGKDAQLAAVVHKWDDFYIRRVMEVLDGKWQGGRSVWHGIADGMVDITAMHPSLPDALKQQVSDTRASIASGNFHPFTGPIRKQNGDIAAKDGEVIPDADLLGMDYYVEGIQGDLPK